MFIDTKCDWTRWVPVLLLGTFCPAGRSCSLLQDNWFTQNRCSATLLNHLLQCTHFSLSLSFFPKENTWVRNCKEFRFEISRVHHIVKRIRVSFRNLTFQKQKHGTQMNFVAFELTTFMLPGSVKLCGEVNWHIQKCDLLLCHAEDASGHKLIWDGQKDSGHTWCSQLLLKNKKGGWIQHVGNCFNCKN